MVNFSLRAGAPLLSLGFIFSISGCGGLLNMLPAMPSSGEPGEQQCQMTTKGETVCGYHCMMDTRGGVHCADAPDGSCEMNSRGGVTCTQKAVAAAPTPAAPEPTPAQPSAPSPSAAQSTPALSGGGLKATTGQTEQSASASCCVNGAYHSCAGASEAAVCMGHPMQMMRCMQQCGMDARGCEEACLSKHGPQPQKSGCKREPARDGQCSR